MLATSLRRARRSGSGTLESLARSVVGITKLSGLWQHHRAELTTGGLEEEKMQVYVRLGIHLLYEGASMRMEGGGARRLLKSLSMKQGVKCDAPESAKDIPVFIEFHRLKIDEILDPLDSFSMLFSYRRSIADRAFRNVRFFYRKLKPTARPIEQPDNPLRIVSSAVSSSSRRSLPSCGSKDESSPSPAYLVRNTRLTFGDKRVALLPYLG